MRSQPKVSVIIPVYNGERYLRECLDSVVSQTLADIEIICVDAGSTDGTLKILAEYAEKDSRVTILHSDVKSYGHQMNMGLEAAAGAYIGVVESDDFIAPSMFQRLYEEACLNTPLPDLVKAGYLQYWGEKPEPLSKQALLQQVRPPKKSFNIYQYSDILYHHPSIWSAIYRRDFLREKEIRFVEAPGAAWVDNPYFMETMCLAERILWVPECFYFYRQDNPDASSNLKDCTIPFLRLLEMFQFLETQRINDKNILKCLYRRVFTYLRSVWNNPNYDHAKVSPLIRDVMCRVQMGIVSGNGFTENERELVRLLRGNAQKKSADSPIVSVIIPVYNAAPYLRQCLNSVLGQTLAQIEIICVDDGSTDDSRAILQEYRERDCRITVLCQKNASAGAARNKGLEIARGEYLSFLDADDFFEPTMLEKAYIECEKTHADVVVFRGDYYHADKNRFEATPWMLKEHLLPEQRPFAATDIEKNFFSAFVFWPWDKLFRASHIRDKHLKFQVQRSTNDLVFVALAVLCSDRISILNETLAHYRRENNGSLSMSRSKSWFCYADALLLLRNELKIRGLYERFEQDFINYALGFSIWHLQTIQGDGYHKILHALKYVWFEQFEITLHDRSYFYFNEQYDEYLRIMGSDDRQKAQPLEVSEQNLKKIRSLEAEINNIHRSLSYRIGRAITFIPRKIRGGIRCYQEHGMRYTLRRIKEKLGL